MSFDDMPDLGPLMLPGAKEYAETALAWSRRAVAETEHKLDIAYGDDFFHKLDVFLPTDGAARDLPVLLFMHGGAWRNGFKEWMGFMAPPLVSLPAIFVTANYRLVPRVKYPAPLDDCIAALAWVHRNIARHGGDPARMFVGGHSAGGHIAALMALRPDLIAAHGLPADCIKGCFALSASLSLDLSQIEKGSRREAVVKAVLADGDDGRDGTVFSHVEGNRVPFFLAHGSNDLPDLMEQNRRLRALLEKQPCATEHLVLEGMDHFTAHLDCARAEGPWVRTVRKRMATAG